MTDYPFLTTAERDRRYARLRAYMADAGLGAILFFGLKGREHFEGYIANETIEGMAILPAESDPVLVSWHPKMVIRRLGSKHDQSRFWIKDTRSGLYGPIIADVLAERGLERARVGVIGLEAGEAGCPEGIVPYPTWRTVLERLPHAEFADVTWDVRAIMLEKSAEEIAVLRHCALLGERAAEAMIATVRPGATEYDVYRAVHAEIYAGGGVSHDPFLIMTWGVDDVGWAEPAFAFQGGPPRVVAPGDLIMAEIFPTYGGLETQQQIAVAVAPVEEEVLALGAVAKASYEAGVKGLSAGRRFSDVTEDMLAPLRAHGNATWTLTPLLHSVAPLAWVGGMAHNLDAVPPKVEPFRHEMDVKMGSRDIRLTEGMSFAFEPNACVGQRRVNIGGTVLVGPERGTELNAVVNRLHVVE